MKLPTFGVRQKFRTSIYLKNFPHFQVWNSALSDNFLFKKKTGSNRNGMGNMRNLNWGGKGQRGKGVIIGVGCWRRQQRVLHSPGALLLWASSGFTDGCPDLCHKLIRKGKFAQKGVQATSKVFIALAFLGHLHHGWGCRKREHHSCLARVTLSFGHWSVGRASLNNPSQMNTFVWAHSGFPPNWERRKQCAGVHRGGILPRGSLKIGNDLDEIPWPLKGEVCTPRGNLEASCISILSFGIALKNSQFLAVAA